MSEEAAGTATGPAAVVAIEQWEPEPLLRDPVAARLLPAGSRAMAALARLGPARRAMIRASERRVPGLWAGMLCRKRYIDDRLLEVAGSLDAVVILGAGLDTRAYRLPALRGIRVLEVDQPASIEAKRARLRRVIGGVPEHVTLVPVDFESDDLAAALAAHGLRDGSRACVVWEAVTQYLTEDAVRATLAALSGAGDGSRLLLTFIRRDFLDGSVPDGLAWLHRRFVGGGLWKFGIAPERLGALLAEHGWSERDQAGPAEHHAAYVAPSGRGLPVLGVERCATADRAAAGPRA